MEIFDHPENCPINQKWREYSIEVFYTEDIFWTYRFTARLTIPSRDMLERTLKQAFPNSSVTFLAAKETKIDNKGDGR